MSGKVNVAVVGATGAVGEIMVEVLEERNFPINQLYPLASSRSAGSRVEFRGEQITVQELERFDFKGVDIGLFSAGASVSKVHAPRAAAVSCVVIDNTSEFRYDADIPLVVPEVNPRAIADYVNRGIIANPNCSTIQMLVALKPIYDAVGISRINVCTYQSVSGTGKEAIEELASQTAALLNGKPISPEVYPKQIAFNCLPHIDVFQDNGYTKEEMKMVNETRKIFEDDTIKVTATTVRVPVLVGHSESVNIRTKRKISAAEARQLMGGFADVKLMDDPAEGIYPTAIDCVGRNETLVGRVREDISQEKGLEMWIVSDNLRRGAAYNAVLIAEHLFG